MDKVTFNLNSIDLNIGTRTISIKHSVELFTDEQRKRYQYFQDWLNVESMYHYSDSLFYVDSKSAKNWNLEKVLDQNGKEKQVDIITPGMQKSEITCIYLCKIYNPVSLAFDNIECIPFKYLNQLLKVKILIPAAR